MSEKLTKLYPKTEKRETAQSDVVTKVLKKKNEFKLKSGAVAEKQQVKKACCWPIHMPNIHYNNLTT